jgi:hypothetical protein
LRRAAAETDAVPSTSRLRTLDYVTNATVNGKDDGGNSITGYTWWNFAYPTLLMSGANAIGATRSL